MKSAVLLLAHGAPERVEDIPAYLSNIRGGRTVSDHIVKEVTERYQAIGGSSPLTAITKQQAEALAARLRVPVYYAMRNWTPYIQDVMAQMQKDGVTRIVAICLAPQYSKRSVGFYFRYVQDAKVQLQYSAEIIWTKTFYSNPKLIAAFVEKLKAIHNGRRVLLTAHSLPESAIQSGDTYDREVRETASLVATEAGLVDCEFAYQSQGMTDEPWLGPTVESRIDAFAQNGMREMVLHPIGFVSDHVEVLYDVDIHFKEYASQRNITLYRPESLNCSPLFIEALAGVAQLKL